MLEDVVRAVQRFDQDQITSTIARAARDAVSLKHSNSLTEVRTGEEDSSHIES